MKTNSGGRLAFKKKLNLTSLEAVICNVALFKSMKEKEFRDTIFIAYNEQGVILEASSEREWERASNFVMDFVKNKRIEILTYGYEKEVYDTLINKNLKEYTKRLKEQEIECPYINLIHYQRLRKSCEYMDREKYVDPLLAWEKKNKVNPNFAYLVVEPKERFDEVKRHILEMLRGTDTPINQYSMRPKQFMVLLMNPDIDSKIREMYNRKEIELNNQSSHVLMTLYGELDLHIPEVKTVPANKKLRRLGYHIIKKELIQEKLKQLKEYYREVTDVLAKMHESYINKYGLGYWFMQLPAKTKTSTLKNIENILNASKISPELAVERLKKHVVCDLEEISRLELMHESRGIKIYKAFVNKCLMLVQEYTLKPSQYQSFGVYLDQLGHYFNASSVRYFGICIKDQCTFYVLLDHKPRSLESMIRNNQLIDQMQISSIILQLLYAINYLHNSEEPRCLGVLDSRFIYFPMCVLLPYLNEEEEGCEEWSFGNDVLQIGKLFKSLLVDPNSELQALIQDMTEPCEFQRIKLSAAILSLQEIINA